MSACFPSFEDYFQALLGFQPYAWQSDLAAQVQTSGWPEQVPVPTGLGKTSVIPIWLYELARQTHVGEVRTAPMRLFYVVNRRTVVDQGARYVAALERALEEAARTGKSAPDPVLTPVRDALRRLLPPGDDRTVVSATIHGESPDDRTWLRATGATVVSLTPAQFVSRLLMRGFGVSPGTRPVHAGLVGVDRLVVFDEPHLSRPALATVRQQEELQGSPELGVPVGSTVELGATLGETSAGAAFDFDLEASLRDPRAAKRLLAPKTLTLLPLKTVSAASLSKAAKEFTIEEVREGAERVLLVLNTVASAQQVYLTLQGLPELADVPLRLLTSRFRPGDKVPLDELRSGPLVLVATQTVEVGVDLTFDALFTEAAPFDALAQRLGRLNRDGAGDHARAVLAVQQSQDGNYVVPRATAHVYGEEPVLAATDLFAATPGPVDVSPANLLRLRAEDPALQSPSPRAATLHSGLLPLITQTRPTPYSDVPVEAFISGPDDAGVRDVLVAWRAHPEQLDNLPAARAPSPLPGEYAGVPPSALVDFLTAKTRATAVADATDVPPDPGARIPLPGDVAARIRVLNPGTEHWVRPAGWGAIQPGAQVVLDKTLGGYTAQLGWRPQSHESVPGAQLRALKRALANQKRALHLPKTLRLGVTADLLGQGDEDQYILAALTASADYLRSLGNADPAELEAVTAEFVQAANALLAALTDNAAEEQSAEVLTASIRPEGFVLPVLLRRKTVAIPTGEVLLEDHARQVAHWAAEAARTVGLRAPLRHAVEAGGYFHDAGKAWGPWQRQWNSEWEPAQPALAKSGAARSRAEIAAVEVPRGWRHEVFSTLAVPDDIAERPLVQHLVGSSHGWFRPLVLPPELEIAGGGEYPQGAAHAEAFQELNERFGPWGLAYLETLVRVADWTASAAPQVVTEEVVFARRESAPSSHAVERREVRLTGLRFTPLAGWYAAVGLLGAAVAMGDSGATLRWECAGGLAGVPPTLPMLETSASLEDLVHFIHESELWDRIEALLAERRCKPFTAKGQKMGPARSLAEVLKAADDGGLQLALGSITDAARADVQEAIPLAVAAFPNNASFVSEANKARKRRNSVRDAVTALGDPDEGFSTSVIDGGLDRPLDYDPAGTGRLGKDARLSRSAVAPAVLWGMTSLGTVPPRGYGIRANHIVLPLPMEPTSLVQLRAWTLLGRAHPRRDWESLGAQWVLEGPKHFEGSSKQEWWLAQPRLRADLVRHP